MAKDYSIGYKFKGDNSGFTKAMGEMNKSISGFMSTIKRAGGLLVGAFSVNAITNFTKESMKLAAAAEGVKTAFAKIGDSRRILDDIKKATRDVIDESDLMALAIKAQNFKIPLQDLGKYLKFATDRAIQTGGSITELTEKIVEGLGRRAPKSMVALGISAADAKKAFAKGGLTGALELVNAEMAKMGDIADTASVRYARFATAVKDLKEAWGESLNESTLVKTVVGNATEVVQRFTDQSLSFFSKMMMSGKQYKAYLEEKSRDMPEWMLSFAGKGTMLGEVNVSPIAKAVVDLEAMAKAAKASTAALEKLKAEYGEIDKIYSNTGSFVNAITPPKALIGGGLARGGSNLAGNIDEKTDFASMAEEAQSYGETILGVAEAFSSLGDAMARASEDGSVNFVEGMNIISQAAMSTIGILSALTAANVIAKESQKGLVGVFSAIAGITLFMGLIATFVKPKKIKGFASGTNFAPGGLSMVGERGPELVNLPRGAQVKPFSSTGMQIQVVGTTRIRGRDLEIAWRRT